jgi:hypothetical protein
LYDLCRYTNECLSASRTDRKRGKDKLANEKKSIFEQRMKLLPIIQVLQKNWQQLKKEEMDKFRHEIHGT